MANTKHQNTQSTAEVVAAESENYEKVAVKCVTC